MNGEAPLQLRVVCFHPFCAFSSTSPAGGSDGEEKLAAVLASQTHDIRRGRSSTYSVSGLKQDKTVWKNPSTVHPNQNMCGQTTLTHINMR